MSRSGRKRVATLAQCAEVKRLDAEGASIRAIAAQVFGDARLRGRVERILKEPATSASRPAREAHLTEDAAVSAETVPAVRAALRQYLTWLQRGEVQPSVGEMVMLLDLERRLQTFESIQQLNALARAEQSDPRSRIDTRRRTMWQSCHIGAPSVSGRRSSPPLNALSLQLAA
jgi:hypothetical protein